MMEWSKAERSQKGNSPIPLCPSGQVFHCWSGAKTGKVLPGVSVKMSEEDDQNFDNMLYICQRIERK